MFQSLDRKGQGGAMDLLMLLIGSMIIVMFLITLLNSDRFDSTSVRFQSYRTHSDLFTILNSRIDDASFNNVSVSEAITMRYCGYNTLNSLDTFFNESSEFFMRDGERFILTACFDGNCSDYRSLAFCSKEIKESLGSCCAKLEKANLAVFTLNLNNLNGCTGNFLDITYGLWKAGENVERC